MKKLLIIASVTLCACHLMSANFFVSNDGSDSNNGLKDTPWKTLFYSAQQLSAGDTLFVMAGEYNEYCTITQQATATNPIVITSITGFEDQTIIDGTGVNILLDGNEEEQGGLIQLVGASYVHISGLVLNNSPKEGIIAYECSNIEFNNLIASKSQSSGIACWNSANVKIKNCTVENACLGQLHEYVTLGATENFEVSGCLVQNSDLGSVKEGIDAKDGSSNGKIFNNTVKNLKAPGIYVDAWTEDTGFINVFNNVVDNCNGIALASEGGGLLHDIQIFNNISVNNINYGCVVGNWGDHSADQRPISNVKIYHNTFVNNAADSDWGGGISLENTDLSNFTIENNIVSNNGMFQIGNESNLNNNEISVNGNLIFGNTNNEIELSEAIYLNADPLLDESNFKLKNLSPAIDAAQSSELEYDIKNTIRPLDGNNDGSKIADIGAWEFNTTTGSINDSKVQNNIAFPNPFTKQLNFNTQKECEKIQVFSLTGVLIYEGMSGTIFTESWTSGTYLVKYCNFNRQGQTQIVVKF